LLIGFACESISCYSIKHAQTLAQEKAIAFHGNHVSFSENWVTQVCSNVELSVPYRIQRITAAHLDALKPEPMFLLKIAAAICIGKSNDAVSFNGQMLMDVHPVPEFKSTVGEALYSLLEHEYISTVTDRTAPPWATAARSTLLTVYRRPSVTSDGAGDCGSPSDDSAKSPTRHLGQPVTPMAIPSYHAAASTGRKNWVNPAQMFRFRYGLQRDVIYQQMQYSQRRELHKAVGEFIKGRLEAFLSEENEISQDIYDRHFFLGLDETGFKIEDGDRKESATSGTSDGLPGQTGTAPAGNLNSRRAQMVTAAAGAFAAGANHTRNRKSSESVQSSKGKSAWASVRSLLPKKGGAGVSSVMIVDDDRPDTPAGRRNRSSQDSTISSAYANEQSDLNAFTRTMTTGGIDDGQNESMMKAVIPEGVEVNSYRRRSLHLSGGAVSSAWRRFIRWIACCSSANASTNALSPQDMPPRFGARPSAVDGALGLASQRSGMFSPPTPRLRELRNALFWPSRRTVTSDTDREMR